MMRKYDYSRSMKLANGVKNVYVKVPVTNSKGKFMGKVIKNFNSNKLKAEYNSSL